MKLEENKFIDRYFESESVLLNIKYAEKRTMTTFMNYLENLHSVADKLKDKFECNIKDVPEFVILRVIRNYFHHVDDIEEYSMFVNCDELGIYEQNRHLIISMKDFAKSIKSFEKNTRNKNYYKKQVEIMSEFIEYWIFDQINELCNLQKFLVDNNDEEYEMGIDLFKYVYNISNIIADRCRAIEVLKNKEVIKGLEYTYTEEYNIPKRDSLRLPGKIPLLTTKGFISPKDKSSIKPVNV